MRGREQCWDGLFAQYETHRLWLVTPLRSDLLIPNTAVFGPTNFIGTIASTTARMTVMKKDDFYGGRTWPLEKFYLFIYFLLI